MENEPVTDKEAKRFAPVIVIVILAVLALVAGFIKFS